VIEKLVGIIGSVGGKPEGVMPSSSAKGRVGVVVWTEEAAQGGIVWHLPFAGMIAVKKE
jgi:hypothetical protein